MPVCKRLRSRGFYVGDPNVVDQLGFPPESSCWCAHAVAAPDLDDILCPLVTAALYRRRQHNEFQSESGGNGLIKVPISREAVTLRGYRWRRLC